MTRQKGPAPRLTADRVARLRRRILAVPKPILWLRALPGAGKTRLLQEVQDGAQGAPFKNWLVLDEPDLAALRSGLAACGALSRPRRRLLLASRTHSDLEQLLLTPQLYGYVEAIDERELFFLAGDWRAASGSGEEGRRTARDDATPGAMDSWEEAVAWSGGWPLLVDAALSGRVAETRRMLPEFLEREVLPDLPVSLVTALFGALPAPLAPAAVDYLFAAGQTLHPLLRATPQGVELAGSALREALLTLRSRPKALPRAVLDELVVLHTRFADPVRAVIALVDLRLFAQAVEVFNAAGGMFFGYRHGYQALATVLERFGAEWERRTESLFFARLYLLIKSGQPREALLRLEAQYPGLPVDLRRLRLSHRPYAVLMRLDMSLDTDDAPPVDVISSWGRLEGFLAPGDDLARGILYNTMAIGFLQAGALVQAQELAEEALAVYNRAGSPYLAHFMHLHLCDLWLRRGRLRDAAAQLRGAEQSLAASGLVFNSEPAIIECFRARIAYEEGRFADCPEDIEPILQALLRGDSWVDLISAVASHCVFAAFWQQGLRRALDRLDHCALTLSRRHGANQSRSIELIRMRLYQAARRHEEAGARLEEYDLEAPMRRFAHLDAEEGLIRLRQQIVQKRPSALSQKFAGRLASLPGLEARQKIALSIMQGYLRQRQQESGAARRHLAVALRNAEAENLIGVLAEYGEFLESLLPLMVDKPGPGNARLAAFAQRIARLLRILPSAPMYSKALAGVTRQEHRVLSYVADGYTNKQIARVLALSESAVKFHLRNLFRKMQVASRAALCEAAARHGIRT